MYVTMKIMEYTKSASFNSARKTIHLYVLGAPVYLKNDRGLIYYNPYSEGSLTSWDQTHLTPVASFQLAKNLLSRTILEN